MCTDYDSESFESLIRTILYQCKQSLFQSIIESGNKFAYMRAASHHFANQALAELTEGVSFYQYINAFIDDFENRIEDFRSQAKSLSNKVFATSRMTVSATGDENVEVCSAISNAFANEAAAPQSDVLRFDVDHKNEPEFISIPSPVSYAATCGCARDEKTANDGSLAVLSNLLTFDYLWDEVRVKGGAYGCRFIAKRGGELGFTTYRDPNPMNSLNVFRTHVTSSMHSTKVA